MIGDAPVRWLWSASTTPARWARASLLPVSAAYGACVQMRTRAYRRGLLRSHRMASPVVAVGNLTVGGSGKTPLASWIAARLASQGLVPGIVLRGYGRDEATVHRERLPQAVVVQGRDRPAAARRALATGADAIVLDDGFQRLDLERDLNLLLISAESAEWSRWLLPAGPWREPRTAARRADVVVITRKRSEPGAAVELARGLADMGVPPGRIARAHLRLASLGDLGADRGLDPARLAGARVLAVCSIADPASFAHQLTRLGADVRCSAWRDHHAYRAADVERLLSAAGHVDYVVTTHKDAVKLRPLWPRDAPRTLVAHLELEWEAGGELVANLISALQARP